MDYKSRMTMYVGILGIIGCFLISGISYAYWVITHTQSTVNVASSGCFSTTFTDANPISLSNTFPMIDSDGFKLTPYTFTINNTCTIAAAYQINLETLNTSTLAVSHVKVALNQTDPALLSSLTTTTKTIDTASESRILKTGILKSGASVTYNLNIWMDQDTTQTDGENKTYSSKVVVMTSAIKLYADASGAAEPELYQGLIPVKYDVSGNTVVADATKEWYNYGNHNWANAVLVNNSNSTIKDTYFNPDMTLKDSAIGTIIPEASILQYYVWIPRYKYLLWNAENGSSNEQSISITFEDKTATKSTGSTNGTWLTHPAFTFGTTELNGIWVGKFENSGTTSQVTIKPNVKSLTNINVSTMFNAVQSVENNSAYGLSAETVDTHMLKNMEWGAVAYLSSSIYGRYTNSTTCIASGCEVWVNNNSNFTTGCAGASVSASSATTCNVWNTTLGVNASTTGNQYGIYDMSGGSNEYVMGNMVNASGFFYSSSAGFSTAPDAKYYNSYAYDTSYITHERGLLGDATKETLKTFGSGNSGGWYSDSAYFPSGVNSWFLRGGHYSSASAAGDFTIDLNTGIGFGTRSFRSVLSEQ